MSNLLWNEKKKKERKKNENRKKNGKKKLQDNEDGKKKEKKKEKTPEYCWTQHMKKKKKEKERTNISFFLSRLYIDWKKEEKKTEHFWTVIVILFWLVVKWNFLSLFEFKGDIRIFFLFILWNLAKTINRGFYTMFTNNCNYIDSKFFLEFGVFVEKEIFFGGVSVFERIGGWRENRTDIHPIG